MEDWRIRNYFPQLSDEVISSLRIFHVELLRINNKLHLIPNFTEKDADLVHFYDSIKASEFIVRDNPKMTEIYDFGPGNGLPGIVLGILYPQINVNLVEADDRNIEFLQHIIARTELRNISLVNIKPEEISILDPVILMSRGMLNLGRTLILGNKVLQKGSVLYTLKGADWFAELAALPSQISSTWNNEMAFEYTLPESMGERVVIRSIKTS